jgi:hypothetical protein
MLIESATEGGAGLPGPSRREFQHLKSMCGGRSDGRGGGGNLDRAAAIAVRKMPHQGSDDSGGTNEEPKLAVLPACQSL